MTAPQPAPSGDVAALLDRLEAAREAATPGPWEHNGNAAHTSVGSCVFTTHRHEREQRRIDAALIVAAVNALPALVVALRDVLRLHMSSGETHAPFCGCCSDYWPCQTVQAVAAALGGLR